MSGEFSKEKEFYSAVPTQQLTHHDERAPRPDTRVHRARALRASPAPYRQMHSQGDRPGIRVAPARPRAPTQRHASAPPRIFLA